MDPNKSPKPSPHPSFGPLEELRHLTTEWMSKGPRLALKVAKAQQTDLKLNTSAQLYLAGAFTKLAWRAMQKPDALRSAQWELMRELFALWVHQGRRHLGLTADEPYIETDRIDRRFRDPGWQKPGFDFVRQAYLLISRWMVQTVDSIEGLDEDTQNQVSFYTQQLVDALAPSNFAWTNPEVLRASFESLGGNLLRGMRNFLSDLDRGKGRLAIRRTDLEAFEIGRNLATTPGKVVAQNELMQLLQYAPATEQVRKRPLLIIPPWINKYYILDLQPKNSFVRYAVEQGFTVFMISWVNPDARLASKDFEDYLREGPLAALDAIEQATGETEVNAIGYCLGGTLLASTLAHLAAKGEKRIKAATFFTTLVDFEDPGELDVFIDEEQLAMIESEMRRHGMLCGKKMAQAFNMLRANDLIWSYVVQNYLLAREPFPFDMLYWNGDSTSMPAVMHRYYLRNMYLENRLVQPDALQLAGTPIDLRRIDVPSYILSCRDDHIAPWQSTYAATQLYQGPVRMVLAGSGHIAGVINPPSRNKYGYWTNDELPADPEAWDATASAHEGSWWPDWLAWAKKRSGRLVAARVPGDGALEPLEEAPGSYVKLRR